MNFIKKYFKLLVGTAVLILVVIVGFFAMRSNDLETGSLKDWRAASLERRISATKIVVGSDDNTDLLVACVDKMATLPDAGEMAVRDAVSLCNMGIVLKSNT